MALEGSMAFSAVWTCCELVRPCLLLNCCTCWQMQLRSARSLCSLLDCFRKNHTSESATALQPSALLGGFVLPWFKVWCARRHYGHLALKTIAIRYAFYYFTNDQ